MAKSVPTVLSFLVIVFNSLLICQNDLKEKLTPLAQIELKKLTELKRADLNIPADQEVSLNSWDFRYYHNMLMESEYKVNENEIKEYFSLDHVTKSMLDGEDIFIFYNVFQFINMF